MYCMECGTESRGSGRFCSKCGRPLTSDADTYFKTGMDAISRGETDKAISLLGEAVSLHEGHLNARFNLGMALSLSGRCDESMEQFVEVARHDSAYPGIFSALGQAAFGSYLRHVEEAEWARKAMFQLLLKAVEQDPEDVDAHFSMASAYIAVGMPEQAIPWLKHALCLHPNSSAIHFTMAKAYRMMNQYDEAVAMARRSVELSTSDDPFADEMGELLAELEAQTVPL